MQTEWKVLIADDEPAARRGVRQLLAAFPEFVVAQECRNGEEALTALATTSADVIFLDIQMPGIDGFEVIRRRTCERPAHAPRIASGPQRTSARGRGPSWDPYRTFVPEVVRPRTGHHRRCPTLRGEGVLDPLRAGGP